MDVNEYLNAAWLGNTVRSWLFAVAILAAAVAALVGIKALVVGRFFKFATRTTNEVDDLVVELPPTARTVVEFAAVIVTSSSRRRTGCSRRITTST